MLVKTLAIELFSANESAHNGHAVGGEGSRLVSANVVTATHCLGGVGLPDKVALLL